MKAELSFPIFFIAIQCRMIWNLYYAIFISPDFKLHVRCTRLQRKCTIKCTVDVCKLNMVVVYFSGLRRKHRTRNLSQFGNAITDEKILSHYKYRLGVYLLKQSLEILSKYISAKPGNHSSSELQLYITRCLSHYKYPLADPAKTELGRLSAKTELRINYIKLNIYSWSVSSQSLK